MSPQGESRSEPRQQFCQHHIACRLDLMDALLSEPLLDAAASDDGEGYFDIAPHSRRTTDETPQQDVYPEKVDVTSPFSAFNSGIGAATHGLTEKSSVSRPRQPLHPFCPSPAPSRAGRNQ